MRLRELSIIQYQNVCKNSQLDRLWLSVQAFGSQMDYFATGDWAVLSMDEAIDFMERKQTIRNCRPVSLTFDNGYWDFYSSVFPILSEYSCPATVLISPARVGKSFDIGSNQVPYLTWSALKELSKHNVAVGAYEDGSWNLNDIPEEKVRKNIIEYKKILEDKLGVPIRYYGVKEGVPNDQTRDLLISEGYRAFLTECPTNRRPDLYSIGRIQVDDDDFNIFLTKISRTYLYFKDKKSWKYIREYSLDKAFHRMSEAYDKLRGL